MSKYTRRRRSPVGREAVLDYLSSSDAPRTEEEIATHLQLRDLTDLRYCLNAMLRTGEVLCNRLGGFGLTRRMDLVTGRVQAHPDGFGFLLQEEEGVDLYLSPRQMQSVLHGDRIIARVSGIDRAGRMRGELVEVTERAHSRIAGQYRVDGNYRYVAPMEPRLRDIEIPADAVGEARPNDHVIVELTRQPELHVPPQGRVVERVQARSPLHLAMTLIAHAHELPTDWPAAVEAELKALSQSVRHTPDREDLRELPLVTIDGADARDFDDAVYCEPDGQGWRLLVAIADVSHYVRPGTALDTEAIHRSTSVYFPTRVIPMLPEVLSNQLCSLIPGEDRLCMACELHLDGSGNPLQSRFFPATLRSQARLSYDEVAALQDSRRAPAHLQQLFRLYALLHERRARAGMLEFETGEVRMDFDADDRISAIISIQRNDAHRLIEEFMLAANVAAAYTLQRLKRPALYRIHEPPPAERLEELRAALQALKLSLGGKGRPDITHYAEVLRQAQQQQIGPLVQTLLLRSMPLAVYSHEPQGHFGLHFEHYTHFTSPIRRYPDVLVHRALKGESSPELKSHAATCSTRERRAEQAERDVVRWCKCDYLKDHVGTEFSGVTTNVQAFGLFVELQGLLMDGLVHVSTLPGDYYHYDRVTQVLRGERRGRSFRMGQTVRVKLVRVDMDTRRIDLRLV